MDRRPEDDEVDPRPLSVSARFDDPAYHLDRVTGYLSCRRCETPAVGGYAAHELLHVLLGPPVTPPPRSPWYQPPRGRDLLTGGPATYGVPPPATASRPRTAPPVP